MKQLPKPLVAFSALAVTFLLLGLLLPPNTPTTQAYHLSDAEYRVVTLLVNIPLLFVWFTGFYGYGKLDEYIALIRKERIGAPMTAISTGLKFLAWGFPVTSILATLLAGLSHSVANLGSLTLIITHYMSLLVALLAFSWMATGSRGMLDIVKERPPLEIIRWLIVLFTTLGVSFTYLTIRVTQTDTTNPYRLPMWLILLTIVIPYLYAWVMGLFAAYEIFLYSKHTKGLLYRRALIYLSGGIVITILASVIFQFIQSDTTRIRRISFSWVFIGAYVLLLLYASGFLLIAKGAKRLKRIEEV